MQATHPTSAASIPEKRSSWLDQPLLNLIVLNWETLLFASIFIIAVITRFYLLEPRVMSHDENSHVYYSWRLFKGQGFAHDPLMHGPFQFHIIALTYFLFGDSDFTSRIPTVLFSIATVAFMWNYRRYLGRAGALVAAVLMTISPYMLFYGRYVRNESFVALFGVITLWATLRYLESGQHRYLYWLTGAMIFHFASKETSFIYMAQLLLFLAGYLIYRITQKAWARPEDRRRFLLALIAALLLFGAAGTVYLARPEAPVETPAVTQEGEQPADSAPARPMPPLALALGVLGAAAVGGGVYYALHGFGLAAIRRERSFDLLMLMGTLVLPQLSALPLFLLGWSLPTNAGEVAALTMPDMLRVAAILVPMLALSVVLGLWWNRRQWLINAALWYGVFVVLFTTVFTNGAGIFTGLVGGLGYWLEQQGVNRGNQPWYYYWLIQVPVYEYLPLLGSLLAAGLAAFGVRWHPVGGIDQPEPALEDGTHHPKTGDEEEAAPGGWVMPPVLSLLGFWVVTSFIAYSVAGEKMPWLTVHITLPMILLAGWSIGYLIDRTDWSLFRSLKGWLVVVLLPVFFTAALAAIGSLLGTHPPFQGQELEQLADTSTFLGAFISALVSGAGLFYLVRTWPAEHFNRVLGLYLFALLAVLTARAAFKASYVSYDDANELLVYAHSAGGVKEALRQIEEISLRTHDGLNMPVAYDSETSYPYLWYLRNYTDARFFGANPTRTLRDVPVILVGDANYGKIEPVVGQAYQQFDYIRLWWPNQDYFDLTPAKIWENLRNPQMRAGLFQIWLNRDYTQYGQATGKDMSLPNWTPSARMRLYVRKDIIGQLWNYGAAPTAEVVQADPYEGKVTNLSADKIIGGMEGVEAAQPLELNRPRGIVVAQDGSLYVSDTGNHRILHLSLDGQILHSWGTFGDVAAGDAPGGTFNEPWGIDLGLDGSVYVADTWNHRIQKFAPDGTFLKMWGYFGQAETPDAFWGPRDVAVDSQGRVMVTDTGNKRVAIFDADGNFITQFGEAGMDAGQFDEQVGLAVDNNGQIYVADTWNQRIQAFTPGEDGTYQPSINWEVFAWYGQSLDNKPYLAVDNKGHVFATDPEGYRVLEFTDNGEFVRYWGDYGAGAEGFGLAGGIAVDADGNVWVTDPGNNRLMRFMMPAQ